MSHALRWRAELALVVMTFIWGLTFPLIGEALETYPVHGFLSARFLLAAILFIPLAWPARHGWRATAVPGVLLGVLSWISYETQTRGLVTVSPARAAFLTASSVLLVPLLAPLFGAGAWKARDLIAAACATVPLAMIVDPGPNLLDISAGDLWVLACAVAWALYIVVLHRVNPRGNDVAALTLWQLAVIALLSLAATGVDLAGGEVLPPVNLKTWIAIVYTATFATVLAFWIQARFQGHTSAGRASLIYTLEPVFALVATWALRGKMMGSKELAGAALLLLIIVASEIVAYLGASPPPAVPAPTPLVEPPPATT